MITEDLSILNRKITNIKYNRYLKRLEVSRYSGDIEYIDIGDIEVGDINQQDNNAVSYISNKPMTFYSELQNISNPTEFSVANTPNGEKFVFATGSWRRIRYNNDFYAKTISIKRFVNGRWYAKGEVVYRNGYLYYATKDTNVFDSVSWAKTSELRLFANLCVNAENLRGTFTVSGDTYYEDKKHIIDSKASLFSWFDKMPDDSYFEDDAGGSGFIINGKDSNTTEFAFSRNLGQDDIIIKSIEVEATLDSTTDKLLDLLFDVDNNHSAMIARENATASKYGFYADKRFIGGTSEINEHVEVKLDCSDNNQKNNSFAIKFRYLSDKDLSSNIYNKIIINYMERTQ